MWHNRCDTMAFGPFIVKHDRVFCKTSQLPQPLASFHFNFFLSIIYIFIYYWQFLNSGFVFIYSSFYINCIQISLLIYIFLISYTVMIIRAVKKLHATRAHCLISTYHVMLCCDLNLYQQLLLKTMSARSGIDKNRLLSGSN